MTFTTKKRNATTAKSSSVFVMKQGLKLAIRECQKNFSKMMRNNQSYEAKLWKLYSEQLEIISIVLGVKKI